MKHKIAAVTSISNVYHDLRGGGGTLLLQYLSRQWGGGGLGCKFLPLILQHCFQFVFHKQAVTTILAKHKIIA